MRQQAHGLVFVQPTVLAGQRPQILLHCSTHVRVQPLALTGQARVTQGISRLI